MPFLCELNSNFISFSILNGANKKQIKMNGFRLNLNGLTRNGGEEMHLVTMRILTVTLWTIANKNIKFVI